MKFTRVLSGTGKLPMNENYMAFKWEKPNTNILFSICQQGKGVRCHMSSDKKSLRLLKTAVAEWCEFCFWAFKTCEIIYAIIPESKPGIIRFTLKCGFKKLVNYKGLTVLIKEKPCHL